MRGSIFQKDTDHSMCGFVKDVTNTSLKRVTVRGVEHERNRCSRELA